MIQSHRESPSSLSWNPAPARAVGHGGLPMGLVMRLRVEAPQGLPVRMCLPSQGLPGNRHASRTWKGEKRFPPLPCEQREPPSLPSKLVFWRCF